MPVSHSRLSHDFLPCAIFPHESSARSVTLLCDCPIFNTTMSSTCLLYVPGKASIQNIKLVLAGNKTACPATNHSLGTPSQSCLSSQCQGQRCLYKEARKPSLNEKKQKGDLNEKKQKGSGSGAGFPGWNKRASKSCHSSVPPLTSVTFSSVPTTTLTSLHCNVDRLKSSVLAPCWLAEG